MSKFTKTIVIMVVALMLIVTAVSAAKLNITWDWEASVPGITAFRYQLDGENVDNWTVVKSDVTSFTAEDLDSNVDHNFYLQQSFDGKAWSDSAVDTIAAIADEEILVEAKVEEPAKTETKEKNVVVKETTTEKTTTVVKENKEAKKEVIIEKAPATKYNDYYTMLSIGGGAYLAGWDGTGLPASFGDTKSYNFKPILEYAPYANLELEFANVARWGRFSGLGVKVGVDYSLMLKKTTDWEKEYTANKMMFWKYNAFQVIDTSLALAYNLKFNNVIGLDIFAGGFASFSLPNPQAAGELRNDAFKVGNAALSFGWLAGLQLNLFAGDVMTFSVAPIYRYEWGNAHQVLLEGSFGFRF